MCGLYLDKKEASINPFGYKCFFDQTERLGFEPREVLPSPVFKTGALNQLDHLSILNCMPETGIEPVRGLARRILSPVRLPVPPLGHISHNDLLLNHYNTPFDLGQHLFLLFYIYF